jgi:hypothetical protein
VEEEEEEEERSGPMWVIGCDDALFMQVQGQGQYTLVAICPIGRSLSLLRVLTPAACLSSQLLDCAAVGLLAFLFVSYQ